ncbi:polymeric immunoglobulin receptor-like isoform X2 [Hypanus sabinus]|uniref:polymeric immunoglobulin receptor-like isoform X2 n=1 Tax=Hypanus sabinus TaxID=79690 RepID=UPI0028C40511|nr:polymeric immunoglobulin receptor-like isoform X2 [Hypanus sabinus]
MWILVLFTCSLPVSGALWAEQYVRGVVGRAIRIDCHHEANYRSHAKYWCHGWTVQCSVLVKTNWQHGWSGRVSITDNPERGIFTVTMKDLHSGDTGWYSCGISTQGTDPMFNVHLQVSDEPVSVPVLRYLSPASVSRLGGSVSVSCESLQGSLPIQYSWYEQTSSGYYKISDTNELALHCQSFNHKHHQYYCSASNQLGARSSGIVKVTVFNNREICSYVTEINDTISGALWAEDQVRGVVGRAVTIDCHYAPMYRSHTKYWYPTWDRQQILSVNANGQNELHGRMTIRDNTSLGIFTVTMENLVYQDRGYYKCGITTSVNHPTFDILVQISSEPVSVPVLQYLSPANVSRLGGSVSVSCESLQGSLPIQYSWYEQTSSGYRKVSGTNELALHCQSFNQQHHQYYCRASNQHGAKFSRIVKVTVFNNGEICSYVTEINGTISGALWAEDQVRGVVGRAVTINCHYAPMYRSHTKYWYPTWDRKQTLSVNANGQNELHGRMTIRDNTSLGIFTVTMENLVSEERGNYRCGITTSGNHPTFDIFVEISNEPPSVPFLQLSPATNGSSCGDSISVSCESVHGSLPIQYLWYKKNTSVDSKISDTNELDLHCQSLKYINYLYYCKASNRQGEISSDMVSVSISNSVSTCRNVIEVNSTEPIDFCENTVIETTTTAKGEESSSTKMLIYIIVLSVIGIPLILVVVCLHFCLKKKNRESKPKTSQRKGNNDTQEMATLEEHVVCTDLHHVRKKQAAAQSVKNETGIVYAELKPRTSHRKGNNDTQNIGNLTCLTCGCFRFS